MSAGFDLYSRIVGGMLPGIGQRRGVEQRFRPGPAPQSAAPQAPAPAPFGYPEGMYAENAVDPFGTATGMPAVAPEGPPQQMTGFRSEAASGDPSYNVKPSFRQTEIASMDAYRKMQNAGRMAPPVKAQAPAVSQQAGFYYLDDGQGNVRPYGYASSPPMIPGYNAVLDPNGKQTFGGPSQQQAPQAMAPAEGGFIDPLTRQQVGGPSQDDGFFAKLLRGFTG